MYLVCALVVTEFVNPGGVLALLGRCRLAWHKIGYRSGAAVLGHWDTPPGQHSSHTHKHKKYTTHSYTKYTPYFSTKIYNRRQKIMTPQL